MGERTPAATQGEEAKPGRQPTREELRAARAYLAAAHADADRFMEETLREVEENMKAEREQGRS
ncbi:hypothetical protein ACP70R_011278 [Stipagrostis hirtigluma subsp. patula]